MQPVPSSHLAIAKQLIAEIESGAFAKGAHLRERDLAAQYGVSRTPIRGALTLLLAQGVLEKRDNRGFFVADMDANRTDLPSDPLELIYERAARDWFEQRVPATFTDRDFQNRYEIGRPQATKVLEKLARDGIIERNPGQGWHFPPTLNTRSMHDDSYAFRRIIEPAGILEPGFRIDLDEAERLVEQHHQMLAADTDSRTPGLSFAMNAAFHEAVARWSGNQFIAAAMAQQNRLRRLLEYASPPDRERRNMTIQEHIDIISLLKAGDNLGAAGLMRDHLRRSESATTLKVLRQNGI